MSDMKLVIVALVLLIFISGCTQLTEFFGESVVSVKTAPKTEGVSDILVVKSVDTLPKDSVLSGQPLLLFIEVENRDEQRPVENVKIDLYDPFIFKDRDGTLCTDPKSKCQQGRCVEKSCTILPLGEEQITFDLEAPSKEEIENIRLEAEMNFKVNYNFYGSQNYPVLVVTMDEIVAKQRAGQKIEKELVPTMSSGPVQIQTELVGRDFILSKYDATLKFTILDKGSKGGVKNSKITEGKLKITFPGSLFQPKTDSEEVKETILVTPDQEKYVREGTGLERYDEKDEPIFSCEVVENDIVCTNEFKSIELFGRESSPLVFEIEDVREIPGPTMMYLIKTKINYEYELTDYVTVTVLP